MKPKTNYMPPDQFKELLDNVDLLNLRKMKVIDVQMLFKIARYCALRITNACEVKVEDFDFELSELYISKTKTGKHVRCPIPKFFHDELKEYLKDKQGRLFETNRYTVRDWLEKLGKQLNIISLTTPQSETGEKTKCHIFRKSIGKDIVFGEFGKGGHIGIAQAQLGHKKATTTADYLKLSIDGAKDFWESRE